MNKLLKYENSKLKKQFIFTLPASQEVCGRMCPGCYAAKAQVRFPNTVMPYRNRMLEASKQEDFETKIVKELTDKKRAANIVRIHESGDFYSQEYIDKWARIAKQLPSITFYAFTKRKADFDFKELEDSNNVVIINSLAGNKINYGTIGYLNNHPCKNVCPATVKATKNSTICGVTCKFCMTKQAQEEGITFVIH